MLTDQAFNMRHLFVVAEPRWCDAAGTSAGIRAVDARRDGGDALSRELCKHTIS